MRWTVLCLCVIFAGIFFSGCGDSGATPTAQAPAPPPGGPPMPGGPPSPGSPGNPGDGGAPAAATPPEGTPNEGAPGAPGGDAPPMPTSGEPGQNGGNSAPGGSSDGAPPGDPNPPNNDQPGDTNPDGTPRQPPPPPPPRTLREQAYAAFRNGDELRGAKLLNAHFAAVPAAKNELAQKMAWYPGLMRPALAPRIGIAVQILEEPLNFKGDPMPVGSPAVTAWVDQQQQAEAVDQGIGRTGRTSKFGRGRTGPIADFSEKSKGDQTQSWPAGQQIHFYLGEFGDWLVEALQERMETGEYGPVLQDLVKQASRSAPRRDANNPEGQPGDGAPGLAGGPSDDGGAPPSPGGGRGG